MPRIDLEEYFPASPRILLEKTRNGPRCLRPDVPDGMLVFVQFEAGEDSLPPSAARIRFETSTLITRYAHLVSDGPLLRGRTPSHSFRDGAYSLTIGMWLNNLRSWTNLASFIGRINPLLPVCPFCTERKEPDDA